MTKQTECILEFDESNYPLIHIFHSGQFDAESMERSFVFYKRYMARERPYALMFEAKDAQRPTTKALELLYGFMKEYADPWGRYCVGVAYVLDSVLMRMIVRSVFFNRKTPVEWIIFEQRPDAERWCRARLSAP